MYAFLNEIHITKKSGKSKQTGEKDKNQTFTWIFLEYSVMCITFSGDKIFPLPVVHTLPF